MWAATTDFTQDTWDFGGVLIDVGGTGCIDTTILQNNGKTYHVTKSYSEILIMESTEDERWWEPDTNEENYFLTRDTKHGGIISLTKGQYDAIRNADIDFEATDELSKSLGTVEIEAGKKIEDLEKIMPLAPVVTVNNWNDGSAELSVTWDFSSVKLSNPGVYEVSGIIQSIGANMDQWVGVNEAGEESTLYNALEKTLYSTKAVGVKAKVYVTEPKKEEVVVKEKKAQSITASSKTVYYGRKAFNINAKSNGNGKLSYSSDNKKVASVSSTGKVTINGCGTAVITISASATDTYKAATKKITINVKAPNISLSKIKSTKKNTISVSWKKIKGLSNYEVWFSKSKSFKSGVVKKKVSASKTSLAQKISGSSKKKVYVKIRTSKSGKTGLWSKVKSVKVK